MFAQFHVPPLAIWLIQQQFALIVILLLHSLHINNCSIELYNSDLQTTIILFTRNVSSHKTDWILDELQLLALFCLLYCRVSSLINALEEECLCLREISINVNKMFIVIFVFILLFVPFFYTDVVVACLLLYPFFKLMLFFVFCFFLSF